MDAGKKTYTTLILVLLVLTSFSQADSTKVEYTEEYPSKAVLFHETICDFLTKREANEKDLWKYSLVAAVIGRLELSYERKLHRNFSINIRTSTSVDNILNLISRPVTARFLPVTYGQDLDFEFRYYYNLNRRLRLGKTVGFSGNYFGLALCNRYSLNSFTGYNYNIYTKVFDRFNDERNYLINYFALIYGIQRRIGRIWFIDCNAGAGYLIEHAHVTLNHLDGKPKSSSKWRYHTYYYKLKLGIGIAF